MNLYILNLLWLFCYYRHMIDFYTAWHIDTIILYHIATLKKPGGVGGH